MPSRLRRQISRYLHGKYCVRNFGGTDDRHPKKTEENIFKHNTLKRY